MSSCVINWWFCSDQQHGRDRAGYGEALIARLAEDLTARFGRGFGRRNLFQMRVFYLAYRETPQPASAQSESRAKARKDPSLCPGRTTSGCWRFGTRKRGCSTKPKPCAEAGRYASSIGRSEPSSTIGPSVQSLPRRGRHELSVANALHREEAVGQRADVFRRAAQGQDLETGVLIEVHVEPGGDGAVAVVLNENFAMYSTTSPTYGITSHQCHTECACPCAAASSASSAGRSRR
jgi:hypothetical protein